MSVLPPSSENVRAATQFVVTLGGIIYGVGLLIVNIDLARYGVFSVSLTRPEYVLAGGLWAFITVLGVGAYDYSLHGAKPEWQGRRYGMLSLRVVITVGILGLATSWIVGNLSRHDPSLADVRSWPVVGLLVNWVCGVLGVRMVRRLGAAQRLSWRDVWGEGRIIDTPAWVFITFLFGLAVYTNEVFPVLAREFGGGRRPAVTLFLTSPGVEWLAGAGLPTGADGRSVSPVTIILETDHLVYVTMAPPLASPLGLLRWPRGRPVQSVVGIDKSKIAGVMYRPTAGARAGEGHAK
jgi:hypothetical protein